MNPNTSTATAIQPRFEVDPTLPGVSFTGTIGSELAKLKALRTSWWLTAITIGLGWFIAGSVAFSFQYYMDGGSGESTVDALDIAVQGQTGSYFAMILLGSLGVIAMTTEYTSGAIRSSLTAVPKRGLLFSAKALALLIWTAVVAALMILGNHVLTSIIAEPLGIMGLFDPEIATMYASSWAAIVLTALLGFGLGALLRSSAGGIVVLAVIMFVIQMVLSILLGVTDQAGWVEFLLRIEFMNLVDNVINPDAGEFSLVPAWEPWQAGIGLVIWAAVPMIAGALAFTRRDS